MCAAASRTAASQAAVLGGRLEVEQQPAQAVDGVRPRCPGWCSTDGTRSGAASSRRCRSRPSRRSMAASACTESSCRSAAIRAALPLLRRDQPAQQLAALGGDVLEPLGGGEAVEGEGDVLAHLPEQAAHVLVEARRPARSTATARRPAARPGAAAGSPRPRSRTPRRELAPRRGGRVGEEVGGVAGPALPQRERRRPPAARVGGVHGDVQRGRCSRRAPRPWRGAGPGRRHPPPPPRPRGSRPARPRPGTSRRTAWPRRGPGRWPGSSARA